MTMSKRKIILQSLGAVAALFAFVFVAGATVGFMEASGREIDVVSIGFALLAGVAILIMAGSIWVGARWMSAIDEAAREAHKAAWYWGGSAGMAVGGVFLILATLPHAASVALPVLWSGRTDPAAYAAMGAFAMMGLMLIGYIIVWAWWWLARR